MFLRKLGQYAVERFHVQFGPNASIGSTTVCIDDYFEIVEAREVHSTAGTDAGAVTLTIEKLTGTQAPAAGQNVFKTSTFNLKAAANTVQRLTVSSLTGLSAAQRAGQLLSPGDRLGFTVAGVLTTLAGLSCIVVVRPTRPAGAQAR